MHYAWTTRGWYWHWWLGLVIGERRSHWHIASAGVFTGNQPIIETRELVYQLEACDTSKVNQQV